jgi:AcrR family transcriptional regulator
MTGLRERKKLDTRRALSDAALELAFERGLDALTREDIAARAGVSLRTFNNYFTNKFEAVAYRQVERMQLSLDLFRQRPDSEPLWTAIETAVLAPLDEEGVGHTIPTAAQRAAIMDVLLAPESRLALSKQLFEDWVTAIAERTGAEPVRDMFPRLAAGIIRAVSEAAMDAYVHADPPVPYVDLLRRGFASVRAGVPAERADA